MYIFKIESESGQEKVDQYIYTNGLSIEKKGDLYSMGDYYDMANFTEECRRMEVEYEELSFREVFPISVGDIISEEKFEEMERFLEDGYEEVGGGNIGNTFRYMDVDGVTYSFIYQSWSNKGAFWQCVYKA